MFDWFDKLFRRREYPTYPTWEDIPAWNKVEDDMNKVVAEPEPTLAECIYTVGTDSDGKVVLKIGATGFGTTTLTMTVDATRQMMRMLEAAIPVNSSEERENV
jgi:hypothetical protein